MFSIKYFIPILFLLGIKCSAQAPSWNWAQSSSGTEYDQCRGICTSVSGNSCIAGEFYSPAFTFGIVTLINTDPSYQTSDAYIAKFDAAGNNIWAKQFFGNRDDMVNSIVFDVHENIYVTGMFSSDTLFIDSAFITRTGGTGYSDIFIAKFDSSGDLLWVKSGNGNGNDGGFQITVDSYGNSWISGYYNSDTLTFDTIFIRNNGNSSLLFVAKFNSSGNILWMKGSNDFSFGTPMGLCSDQYGNAFLTGYFMGTSLTLGGATVTNSSPSDDDGFIFRLDSMGNTTLAKGFGGTQTDHGGAITTDSNGNIYISVTSQSQLLNLDTIIVPNLGGNFDILIVKLDSTGHALWVACTGSGDNEYAKGISLDPLGNLFIYGPFRHSLTIGNTALDNADPADYTWDNFIAKLDVNGNFLWAKSIGGPGNDYANGIALDYYGNLFISGNFESGSIFFDQISLMNTSTSAVFIAKLDFLTSLGEINSPASIDVFPNPSNGEFLVSSSDLIRVLEITDLTGRTVFKTTPGEFSCRVVLETDQICLVIVTTDDRRIIKKLVVIH